MRLEKIVLNGFKSFADKTEFAFETPLTAIVGPNGCGKSNVVDAIKWVLGEQSVKSLRSGQMADVIFSGSSSRKALGMSEVSLFISNTRGQLPLEADEVQITRRIYKSGESEYRINNKICRLKDIRELFMDTGIGVRAYSIIEQGQVEQLVTASKADRRAIFEEAAGISKYKAHKKEALRKLEQTEQNLLRLADILGEVQKRLRSVKLAAGKARNFLQYSERLKELQVNYSLAEFDKNQKLSIEKRDALEEIQSQFAAIVAEVSKNDALMSELGQRIIETENQINKTDNSLVSAQSKIEQNLQQIEFLQSRIEELQQRKENAEQRVKELQEQKKLFENNLTNSNSEQIECEKALEQKSKAIEQIQKELGEVNAECASLAADLEDEKSGIIDIVRMTAQFHNEVQSINVHRNNLSSQKDRLAGRAQVVGKELEKWLTDKAQHNARHSDIKKVLEQLQQNLDSKRKEIEEIEESLEADNKRVAHSKEVRSALNSELTILTDMENRREGLDNSVKNILANQSSENKFDYIEGILADIIAADVKYATAIEAALEGKTDALVVNDTGKLLADIETIEKLEGRVNFICADKLLPFVDNKDLSKLPGVNGRAVEFIKTKSKYASLAWKLLGKTIIVDSIDTAVELAKKTGKEYEFVTLKGEILSANGTIKLGPLGKRTGLISRRSRLRQLEGAIDNTTNEIGQIEEQIEKHNQTKEHLVKLCKDLRTAIYEANTEEMQVSSKLHVLEQNIKRLRGEQPLITGEIDTLEEQIAQSVQKEYNSKQKLEELETVNSQRSERIEELNAKYTEQKSKQQKLTDSLTDLRVSLGQITEQNKALKQTIISLKNQLHTNLTDTETARAEIQNCDAQSSQAQMDILNNEAAVSEMFVEKEKRQQSSKELHDRIEELIEEQKQAEQLVRQKRTDQAETDQKINEIKIELSQLEVKQQGLVERVQEELQIDLADAYDNYNDSEVNWEQVREQIAELRGKIERLGNVNVDAITEQEELEKRNEFLSSQVEDLNDSKSQLQQLINRLNKKCREKFLKTFEEVRVNFQEIFRKLFGGGKADIMLGGPEGNEDILEAGIEIMARPPGKETRSISLLSGGEKSMTALALLFAIFKTKPSPFCLLDEVDAALDEANNERFNLLIREFSKNSEFIIITHSKRTMSIVDVLYGITMQTRGVSKKISVSFDKYEQAEQTTAVA